MATLLREKTAMSAGQKLKYWWDREVNEDGTATVNCAEGPFDVILAEVEAADANAAGTNPGPKSVAALLHERARKLKRRRSAPPAPAAAARPQPARPQPARPQPARPQPARPIALSPYHLQSSDDDDDEPLGARRRRRRSSSPSPPPPPPPPPAAQPPPAAAPPRDRHRPIALSPGHRRASPLQEQLVEEEDAVDDVAADGVAAAAVRQHVVGDSQVDDLSQLEVEPARKAAFRRVVREARAEFNKVAFTDMNMASLRRKVAAEELQSMVRACRRTRSISSHLALSHLPPYRPIALSPYEPPSQRCVWQVSKLAREANVKAALLARAEAAESEAAEQVHICRARPIVPYRPIALFALSPYRPIALSPYRPMIPAVRVAGQCACSRGKSQGGAAGEGRGGGERRGRAGE